MAFQFRIIRLCKQISLNSNSASSFDKCVTNVIRHWICQPMSRQLKEVPLRCCQRSNGGRWCSTARWLWIRVCRWRSRWLGMSCVPFTSKGSCTDWKMWPPTLRDLYRDNFEVSWRFESFIICPEAHLADRKNINDFLLWNFQHALYIVLRRWRYSLMNLLPLLRKLKTGNVWCLQLCHSGERKFLLKSVEFCGLYPEKNKTIQEHF